MDVNTLKNNISGVEFVKLHHEARMMVKKNLELILNECLSKEFELSQIDCIDTYKYGSFDLCRAVTEEKAFALFLEYEKYDGSSRLLPRETYRSLLAGNCKNYSEEDTLFIMYFGFRENMPESYCKIYDYFFSYEEIMNLLKMDDALAGDENIDE